MKVKKRMLLVLPLICCFVYALGAPVLAWLQTMLPVVSGWAFWPILSLLLSSITLSYMLPYGRLSSALHIIGEACMPLMLTLSPLLLFSWALWLIWRETPVREAGWIVLALYAALCVIGIVNGRRIRTKRYTLMFDKPFPRLRIALISDLHLGAFTRRGMMQRIVDAVLHWKPDFVILAGDLFDDRLEDVRFPDRALTQLQRLTGACPVFACEGNHDLFEKENPKRNAFIARAGIRWLRDESLAYAGVQLAFRKDARSGERLSPAQLLADLDAELPILVADHNPSDAEALWAAGADLVLSGHTHGGQTFPGNLLFRLGPTPSYGFRQVDGRCAIVTSGAGDYGTPIRLGVNNEVVVIDLETGLACGVGERGENAGFLSFDALSENETSVT